MCTDQTENIVNGRPLDVNEIKQTLYYNGHCTIMSGCWKYSQVVKARLHIPSLSPSPTSCYHCVNEDGPSSCRMGSVPILQEDGPFPLTQ